MVNTFISLREHAVGYLLKNQMLFSKHLSFFYGDFEKMRNNISYHLRRYEAIENKTAKILKRINDYKNILKCHQT